jgi:phosphate/sulfate permease
MTMREGMAERENAAGADPAAGTGNASGLAARLAICAVFVGIAGLYALLRGGEFAVMIALAAGFGAYMALNIGANDVANNVGPAVGARVLTLGAALVIAAIFEAAGAIIAGGDVVATIRGGIIDPELVPDVQSFVWLMMAALLAAAVWLNAATALGAPVSTTHSIVGGVLGGGIAAAGPAIVNWPVMGSIAASWVVSPLLGAGISACLLYIVNRTMLQQPDVHAAGCRVVPLLVGAMAWAFVTYLMLKGLHRIVPVTPGAAGGIGIVAGALGWFLMRALVRQRIALERPGAAAVNRLLAAPLIFAAALLSFAHGSNDVANAIGPLAAIVDVLGAPESDIAAAAPIPFWVIILGAIGIVIGLALFGPRIIRTVGSELTKLDPTRAYCVAHGGGTDGDPCEPARPSGFHDARDGRSGAGGWLPARVPAGELRTDAGRDPGPPSSRGPGGDRRLRCPLHRGPDRRARADAEGTQAPFPRGSRLGLAREEGAQAPPEGPCAGLGQARAGDQDHRGVAHHRAGDRPDRGIPVLHPSWHAAAVRFRNWLLARTLSFRSTLAEIPVGKMRGGASARPSFRSHPGWCRAERTVSLSLRGYRSHSIRA